MEIPRGATNNKVARVRARKGAGPSDKMHEQGRG